jgi:hypothetical protein
MAIRREFLHTTLNDLGKSRSVELRQIAPLACPLKTKAKRPTLPPGVSLRGLKSRQGGEN